MKYDDGIIVSHDRPLNPKTKKIQYQELVPTSTEEKIKTKQQFKDFENKLVDTNAIKKMAGANFKG